MSERARTKGKEKERQKAKRLNKIDRTLSSEYDPVAFRIRQPSKQVLSPSRTAIHPRKRLVLVVL